MQRHSEKSLQSTKNLGEIIRRYRTLKDLPCTKFAYQFDIDKGNLNRIKNGVIDCKFTTLWKISEAHEIKLTDLVKNIEDELGSDFKINDIE